MRLSLHARMLAVGLMSSHLLGSSAPADIHVELIRQGMPETYPLPNEPALGPNIQIPADLGVTLSNVTMIRVYTDDPPTESIGQITITDTRSTSNPLDVLVSSQPFFPFDPTSPLLNGALHWDGITCSTDCKAAVRLAAGVNGTVTGSVNVGQIFRLQAAGSIMQSVHASNADGVPQPGFAISVINAGSISGEVQAELGTIDSVVATSPMSSGITGHILAPHGAIRDVTSLSEIGQQSSSTPVRIEAKSGIGSISGTVIHADIKADVNSGTGVINLVKTTGTSISGHFKGALRSHGLLAGTGESGVVLTGKLMAPVAIEGSCAAPISLAGDCESAISVSANVTAPITIAGSVTANAPITVGGNVAASITATGSISAPISISGSVAANSDIKAARFAQPISISGALKSSIRATGPSTGYAIDEINVGSLEAEPPSSAFAASPMIEVTGSSSSGRGIRKLVVGGEVSATVNSNQNLLGWRIICSHIELLETGASIGSGDAVFSLLRRATRPNGSGASAQDGVAIGKLKIRGTYAGEIHVASLETIDIDEHAGAVYLWQPYAAATTNGSFRVGRSCNGLVAFKSSTGLRDSLIANRQAEAGADFGGIVSVALPSTLSTFCNAPVAGVLPEASSVYGGGSIALWPYRLYRADCEPLGFLTQNALVDNFPPGYVPLLAGDLGSQDSSVKVRFTGPIRSNVNVTNPVRLDLVRYVSGVWLNLRIPGDRLSVSIPTLSAGGMGREIQITGNGTYQFAPGLYRVTLNPDVTNPIFCDGIVDESGTPVAGLPLPPFEYYFWLDEDSVYGGDCSVGDFDNNGGVDGGDLAAFFIAFEAGEPEADVDENGGVDGGDIGTFFHWFETGGC